MKDDDSPIEKLWNFCFGLRKRHRELSQRVDDLEDMLGLHILKDQD